MNLLPWQNSREFIVSSKHKPEQLLAKIKNSFDFEGSVTPIDHFISGNKSFIGTIDLVKSEFLIYCRHGSQGTPFFARTAIGKVINNMNGSDIHYRFVLRPWDRFMLVLFLLLIFAFNLLAIYSVIVRPTSEYFSLLAILLFIFAITWLIPRIAQWYYRNDENKIAALIEKLAK